MHHSLRSSLFGILLIAGVTPAIHAQDRPMKGYWRCDTNNGPATIYATPFMDWTGFGQELGNGFQQYLQGKYGYKGEVSCSMATPGANTLDKLQADMQRQYAQFRAQGKTIVEVPWTITSPGVTLAYACFGLGQVSRDSSYYLHSKTIRVPVGGMSDLSTAWINHLKGIHPGWYFQQPGCIMLPADPAKHQAIIQSQLGMYPNLKARVEQLDWEYTPGASQSSPVTAPAAQAPTPPPPAPGGQAPNQAYPTKDRFGRPLPKLTFYCQYLGLALDASGKYPLYQDELFSIATMQGAVQNAWKQYIETTYPQTSPGNPMCAIVPDDPAQREGVMKSYDLLKQPATQKVVKVSWKP